MAKWALMRKELHDSLSLCNWMGPWVASPLRERGYAGDDSIESMLYKLATGDNEGPGGTGCGGGAHLSPPPGL